MPTVGIDHIAMPTTNAERLIAFYKRLGFPINNEAAGRTGKVPIFSIQAAVVAARYRRAASVPVTRMTTCRHG